jgi:predicted RNA-binding protein with PUA-like domain
VMKKASAARSQPSASAPGYWLFKSEPSAFGIADLAAAKAQTAPWDGVRNYQARNYLRDSVRVGDRVLFYHSREEPLGVFGTMQVVQAAAPDPSQFEPSSPYFDPKSPRDNPRWMMVHVKLLQRFAQPVTRPMLQACHETQGMLVLRRGMRLSIQPVQPAEWAAVLRLAGVS